MSKFQIKPTKHFLERCDLRNFDFSIIAHISLYVLGNPKLSGQFELSNGNSTIVAEYDRRFNVVRLITGWAGNREKAELNNSVSFKA